MSIHQQWEYYIHNLCPGEMNAALVSTLTCPGTGRRDAVAILSSKGSGPTQERGEKDERTMRRQALAALVVAVAGLGACSPVSSEFSDDGRHSPSNLEAREAEVRAHLEYLECRIDDLERGGGYRMCGYPTGSGYEPLGG